MNETVLPSRQASSRRTRNILLGVGGGVLFLLLCCCLAIVMLVVVDPFKLNLISRLTGGYDAPATAMPPDTDLYMGVNLLNLRTEKVNRIIAAFTEQTEQMEVRDTDSLIEEIDQNMQEELGMTLTEDVMPWIGQYAGFGLTSINLGEFGDVESADWIFAVEARNTKAADDFLKKFAEKLADSSGASISEEEYQGVRITELDSGFEAERVAFARSERLVIFGANMGAVQTAIDAQKKDSLSEQSGYKNLARKLPAQRALTMYIDGRQLQDLLKAMPGAGLGNLPTNISLIGWREALFSVSAVDAGIQLDAVYAYDLATLSEEQKTLMESGGAVVRTPELFPEDTLLFIAGQHLDLVWKAYRQVLEQSLGSADIDEAMGMFQQQYGINPDTDLFPYLNGEWAVGVMPSSEGLLVQSANVDLGFALLAETSDVAATRQMMDKLRPVLEEQGLTLNDFDSDGITFTQLENPFSGDVMAAYCVSNQYLALGSSGNLLKNMFSGVKPLSRSARFTQVWRAFPKGMTPALYIDLDKILGILQESMGPTDESIKLLSPIQFIASASSPLQDGAGRSTVIVFISTE